MKDSTFWNRAESVSNCQSQTIQHGVNYISSSLFNGDANFKRAILDVGKLRWSTVKSPSTREYPAMLVWHEEAKNTFSLCHDFKNLKPSEI